MRAPPRLLHPRAAPAAWSSTGSRWPRARSGGSNGPTTPSSTSRAAWPSSSRWAATSPSASRPKKRCGRAKSACSALVSASADVIWRTNAAGEVLFVSPSWEELTGQTGRGDAQARLAGVRPSGRPGAPHGGLDGGGGGKALLRERAAGAHPRRPLPPFPDPRGAHPRRRRQHPRVDRHQHRHHRAQGGGERAPRGPAPLPAGHRRRRRRASGSSTSTAGEMYIDPQLKAILGYEDHEIRNHLDDWMQRHAPGGRRPREGRRRRLRGGRDAPTTRTSTGWSTRTEASAGSWPGGAWSAAPESAAAWSAPTRT